MHTKTVVFDRKVVFTGSMNLTENSVAQNKEHLWMIREEGCVSEVVADFEEMWAKSQIVTATEIELMLKKDRETKAKKQQKAAASQSSGAVEDSESSSEPPAPKSQPKKRAPPALPAWAREVDSSSAKAGASSSVTLKVQTQPKRSGNKKSAFKTLEVVVDSGANESVIPEHLVETLDGSKAVVSPQLQDANSVD